MCVWTGFAEPCSEVLCVCVCVCVRVYLMCECGQALLNPALRWKKSLSLNILSLKKASSLKNSSDTAANEDSPSGPGGGFCSSSVSVTPPRVRRSKASGFIGSDLLPPEDRPITGERAVTEMTRWNSHNAMCCCGPVSAGF